MNINEKLIKDSLEKTWRRPDNTKMDLKEDERWGAKFIEHVHDFFQWRFTADRSSIHMKSA